jgi:zinc protease
MRTPTLLLAALLASGIAHAAKPPPAPATEVAVRTLPNGMKVLVWPDHDIPNVALYTFYRVGSRNERPGITGISHYFEHMMFNGTSTRAPGEFDRVMEANGGANNAYTNSDVTVYQDWFPRSALRLIFDLESDRMRNLSFDPAVVESERGVVYSERRSSVDNSQFGALYEQVKATMFVAHPYQIPTIGWPSDIEGWRIDDLKDYYRTYYAPNNATLLVVGDVTPQEVFALADEFLAGIPSQPAPLAVTTVEPEQKGEKRLTLRKEGQTPVLMMAWHGAAAGTADAKRLELLSAILSDGESSRLYRRLVDRERIALAVGTGQQTGFDPGMVYLYAVLPPGGDPAKVEAAIDQELARVAAEGVSDGELAKARNIKLADHFRSMRTISGKAQALGIAEVFRGGYAAAFDEPAAYARISGAELKEVAARVLNPDNRTVGTLLPLGTK